MYQLSGVETFEIFMIESLVFALPVIILLKGLCSYFYTFNSESGDI